MYQPSIVEVIGESVKVLDVPTKLFQHRIIYFGEELTESTANDIIQQLLILDYQKIEPINLYIKSPGGAAYDAFAINDVIRSLKSKVNTVGLGMVASAGAYLLAAGTGTRKAAKSCRIMLHPVSGVIAGSFPDAMIEADEIKFTNEKMFKDLEMFSNSKIKYEDYKRDTYLTAQEALDLGIIDVII